MRCKTMNRQDPSHHDRLVRATIKWLLTTYDSIYADVPGMGQPAKRGDYIPDVVAHRSGKPLVIAEAETADTIGGEHTTGQWAAFAKAATASGAAFVVVVPTGSESAATKRLAVLGLRGQVVSFSV
jgi:hypothetical protein